MRFPADGWLAGPLRSEASARGMPPGLGQEPPAREGPWPGAQKEAPWPVARTGTRLEGPSPRLGACGQPAKGPSPRLGANEESGEGRKPSPYTPYQAMPSSCQPAASSMSRSAEFVV